METSADPSKTQKPLEIAELEILQKITGKTLRDSINNEKIWTHEETVFRPRNLRLNRQ